MKNKGKRGIEKVPRFFVVLVVMLLSVMPSCSKKRPVSSLVDRQREAQMVGMPLPVGGELVPIATKTNGNARKGIVLRYRIAATREALVRYYEAEMMRLGWNKVAQSSNFEEILIFENPSNVALVQIRPEKKGKIFLTLHYIDKE